MLYCYSLSATQENWLHESLCAMLRTIHESIRAGVEPFRWPDIIPHERRTVLERRRGLKSRLEAYRDGLRVLSSEDRDKVLATVEAQNRIPELLRGTAECESVSSLPDAMRTPICDLFRFAFDLLGDLGIRDRQYARLYPEMPDALCPFCGCEYFDAPTAPREALDHYLAVALYPFAGANLRNLVPMGPKCNSKYKLAQDILRSPSGQRRRSPDPYACTEIVISLSNSEPFGGSSRQLPMWVIELQPDSEHAATWEQVFHIRERYRRDVLDPSYPGWLREFRSWCRGRTETPKTQKELIEVIDRYVENKLTLGLQDRAFLKAAVFRMLGLKCQAGNTRLVRLLIDVIGPAGETKKAEVA